MQAWLTCRLLSTQHWLSKPMRSPWLKALMVGAALAAAPISASAHTVTADTPSLLVPVSATDYVMGDINAPITIVEYASITCSHCRNWHNDTLPVLKREFIDTGKARFVYRTMPTQPQEISATGAAIAHCAVPGKFFDTISAFFGAYQKLSEGKTSEFFDAGVQASGRTQQEIVTCLSEQATSDWLMGQLAGAREAGVPGTPTIFVNGEQLPGNDLESVRAAVIEALGASPASGSQ